MTVWIEWALVGGVALCVGIVMYIAPRLLYEQQQANAERRHVEAALETLMREARR